MSESVRSQTKCHRLIYIQPPVSVRTLILSAFQCERERRSVSAISLLTPLPPPAAFDVPECMHEHARTNKLTRTHAAAHMRMLKHGCECTRVQADLLSSVRMPVVTRLRRTLE